MHPRPPTGIAPRTLRGTPFFALHLLQRSSFCFPRTFGAASMPRGRKGTTFATSDGGAQVFEAPSAYSSAQVVKVSRSGRVVITERNLGRAFFCPLFSTQLVYHTYCFVKTEPHNSSTARSHNSTAVHTVVEYPTTAAQHEYHALSGTRADCTDSIARRLTAHDGATRRRPDTDTPQKRSTTL